MDSHPLKFARLKNWTSHELEDGFYPTKVVPYLTSAFDTIRRGFNRGSESVRSFKKPLNNFQHVDHRHTKDSGSRNNIFDPQGSFLQKWDKIIFVSCVLSLSFDPLFFYIPVINGIDKCLTLDTFVQTLACVLRSLFDILYFIHIIFQFRTGFIAPSSRVFGRGELVRNPWTIAKRYLPHFFIIDIPAILPLPQWVVLFNIPPLQSQVSSHLKESLKTVIFIQYVPRIFRIFPVYKQVTRTSGILTEIPWLGALYNLICYMLASQVVGAFWYLLSIEREETCWREACQRKKVDYRILYCRNNRTEGNAFLGDYCPLIKPDDINNSTVFDYGIFYDALKSGVLESGDFLNKFSYCFWWGLRGLSSLGQNLKTSTYIWEILFAVSISISGLVLFAFLIGNMQKYLQSTSVRIEEMRLKRRDAEQWMSHRMLPKDLRDRIRRYEQYKWQETRGVQEETLIRNLPKDIRKDIKRHLCWTLLKRVPMFDKLDEQLMDALCNRLKHVLYIKNSFIFREGDPVDEMLFIMRGKVTTGSGNPNFFSSAYLKAGDFCGEELLTWALDPHSSPNLPLSTRTVEAPTEVEAFALMPNDLKFVASQLLSLHSRQLQHTFKFYSLQWRTWAACFLQVAWRQYCKRKHEKALLEAEERLQDASAKETGTSSSLGATFYASKFASNALRNLRQNAGLNTRLQQRYSPLPPQKPNVPDFTTNDM